MSAVLKELLGWEYFAETAIAVLLVVAVPLIAKTLWRHFKVYRAFRNIYCDPDMHLVFGHAPRLLNDMGAALDWFLDIAKTQGHKCLCMCYGPTLNQLVAVHADTARIVMQKDPKSDVIYYPLMPWLGEGLLTANGERWSRSRRLLTPAFHFDILRPYVKVYGECAQVMVDLWAAVPEGKSFDVFPYISLFTLDVMLRCTCSFKSDCQRAKTHHPYVTAVYQLSDLVVKRILSIAAYYNLVYMMTADYWRFRRACKTVHAFSLDVIRKRRAALEAGSKDDEVLSKSKRKYLDFIDILLEAKDDDGVGLSDYEIQAEVDTFMFEGHDTTASGIVWTLYNLALHPEHQELCRQEVDEIFQQKDYIEWQDLKSLVYLKYCIKESMRLFPPVSAMGRVLAKPTEVDGHMMPTGTLVTCMIYAVHRNPDVWTDPDEFNPLRFTPENSKGRHSHAYIPFSAGPRNCIGQEFALNEECVALAHILRRFELTLDKEKPVSKDFLVILRPKPGLFLKLKHRRHKDDI